MLEAAQRWDQASISYDDDSELLRLCEQLLQEPAYQPGIRMGRAPARRLRQSVREHLLVGALAFELGLYDRTYRSLALALEAAPNEQSTLRLLAAVHHRRGRLSEAIGIWRDLALRTTAEPSALLHLGQLFELSLREPYERDRLAPPALLSALQGSFQDIEQSFRLAFSRNWAGALRIVDRVLARSRNKDAHVTKVAAIQRAWLLEQSGDFHGAIATLEQLAYEPGLANDVERLLTLSNLYERVGTPLFLRRAIRAVRYASLVRHDPSLLRRTARLLEQIGLDEAAAAFDLRYLELFRKRSHGLDVRDFARAAALCYVPIEKLRRFPIAEREARQTMQRLLDRTRLEHRRRGAVLACVLGEGRLAMAAYEELLRIPEPNPVDLLYRADLESAGATDGTDESFRLRLAALERLRKPDALTLVPALLQALGDRGRMTEILHRAPSKPTLAALAARAKHETDDATLFLAMAGVQEFVGELRDARHARANARILARGGPRIMPKTVLAAAAFRHGGEVRGIMHQIWIESRRTKPNAGGFFEPSDVLGNVSPDLRINVVNAFHSVLSLVRRHNPHRLKFICGHRFVLKFTKDDEPSSGDSAGLAIALAFWSAFMGRPVPTDIAFSGAIVCDSEDVIMVTRIGDIEAKIEGAYERRLRHIVLPRGNEPDVLRAERIPRDVARQLVVYADTFTDVVEFLERTRREVAEDLIR